MSLAFEGAREKALELGIRVTLGVIRKDEDPEESIFSICDSQSLVGYIFGTILTRKIDPPKPLFKVPSILVNCYDQQRRLPTIVPGDVAGGRAATERLIAAGCRRIALIDGQEGLDNPRDRLRGYKQALASNDLAYDPELVHYGNWEPSSGYKKNPSFDEAAGSAGGSTFRWWDLQRTGSTSILALPSPPFLSCASGGIGGNFLFRGSSQGPTIESATALVKIGLTTFR